MKYYSYQGVALIQVLVMTAIMSLIAIQFSKTARHQVETASDFNNRIIAQLRLKTAKSNILYNLFKHEPIQLSDKNINGVKWNLRGTEFKFSEGVRVSIISSSAYLSVSTAPRDYLMKLFLSTGIKSSEATGIVDSITDWVDRDDYVSPYGAESQYYRTKGTSPRNGPMQHISELKAVKGVTEPVYQQVKNLLTVYPTRSLNPSLAPNSLIKILFDEDTASQIIEAKSRQKFDREIWRGIVGSRVYPFIDLQPAMIVSITINAQYQDVLLTEQFDVKIQSQKKNDPLVILASY